MSELSRLKNADGCRSLKTVMKAGKEIISIPGKVCYNKARKRNRLTFTGNFSVNLEL